MTHNFAILISPPEVDEETAADKLYAGGCVDAIVSVSEGAYEIEFDRDAPSLDEAMQSAIQDVEASGIGSRVLGSRVPGSLTLFIDDSSPQ